MYIYDQLDKNHKVVNLLEREEWDNVYQTSRMWTFVAILPQIGALVTYQDESYVIISTQTYQEESGVPDKLQITTFCDLLRVNDEGDDMGEALIKVLADELTLI